MRRVALDVDGVLCQFHEFCIGIAKERYGLPDHFMPEHALHWDVTRILEDAGDAASLNEVIRSPGFAKRIPPYREAVEAVRAMRGSGVEVLFATAPNYHSETWMWDRKLWLKEHFDAPEDDILFVHRKHVVRADVFVDDKLSAVRDWMAENPGGAGFVWDTSYNRDGSSDVPRTSSWDDVIRAATDG